MKRDQAIDDLKSDQGPRWKSKLRLIPIDIIRVQFKHEDFAEVGVRMEEHDPVLQTCE